MDSGVCSSQISEPHDVFSRKSSNSANDRCKTRLWPLKCRTYWYQSSQDLYKQISCMYTNCTDPGSCIHINIISSCYLQSTPLKHHHLCYLITPHDADCKTVFPTTM